MGPARYRDANNASCVSSPSPSPRAKETQIRAGALVTHTPPTTSIFHRANVIIFLSPRRVGADSFWRLPGLDLSITCGGEGRVGGGGGLASELYLLHVGKEKYGGLNFLPKMEEFASDSILAVR